MAMGHSLEPPFFTGSLMATAQARKPSDPAELATKLGHQFAKPDLLQEALTHPSLAAAKTRKKAAAYERLEFLGDRVLGLVVAQWLFEKYPDSNEGDLAKRHAALVNRDALRAIAVEIGLAQYLRLARGEEADSGRKNRSTLPDAMEAVIGALYMDGGLKVAENFIRQYWQRDIATAEAPADPKTALQEWAQARSLPLPAYKVLDRSGPAHAPKFVIEASVQNQPAVTAEGNSKRAAEKEAAILLLAQVTHSNNTQVQKKS